MTETINEEPTQHVTFTVHRYKIATHTDRVTQHFTYANIVQIVRQGNIHLDHQVAALKMGFCLIGVPSWIGLTQIRPENCGLETGLGLEVW